MKLWQHAAVLVIASLTVLGCVEGEDPESEDFSVTEQGHFNHWAASPVPNVMAIGVQPNTEAIWNGWSKTATNGCRNFNVRDYSSSFPGLSGAGTATFRTRDANVISADWDYHDGYGGDVWDRYVQLWNGTSSAQPYWYNHYVEGVYEVAGVTYLPDGSWVFRNTAVTDHPADYCNHAFITTFWGDASYYPQHSSDWIGAYWIEVDLEHEIDDWAACTTNSGEAQPWTAMDLYVYECPVGGGTCQTVRPYASSLRPYSSSAFPVDGSVSRTSGSWHNSGTCNTAVGTYYIPRVGYYPLVMNIVSSAGVGHVPSAAVTKVWRLYN